MVTFLPSSDAPRAVSLWRALEERAGAYRLAASSEWTETWLRHFGAAVPHRFAVWPHAAAPRGIALVCEERGRRDGPFPVRAVHIGTAGEPPGESVHVEYNGLLAEPDASAAFASDLLRALRRERWDEIVLDGFARREIEPVLEREAGVEVHAEPAPLMLLGDGDVLERLRSSTRQRVRRSLRGFGDVSCEWAATPADAAAILDELVALHQRRWTSAGKPGAFAGVSFTGFHRDLVQRLQPSGRVVLFRAHCPSGTIGCLYSFVEDGRVLFYQSGFGEFSDNKLKPGLAVHALCMQACAERGMREYNFLAGESRYKRELSTDEDEIVWATVRRATPKLRAIAAARAAKRWLRKPPHQLPEAGVS